MTKELNALHLPLNGLQAIEASAGTGKTWTLSALYVRLVLGHGLSRPLNPPQILVMTFTELATAELRGRIRKRLYSAAQYFQSPSIDLPGVDDFLKELKSSYKEAEWLTCAKRLDLSAQWMDEAAIFTIHAWSARMLKEHAFDSKSLFDQSLIDDAKKLKLNAAQEYFRRYYYPLSLSQVRALGEIGGLCASPEKLLEKLKPIFSKKSRSPLATYVGDISPLEYEEKLQTWRDRFQIIQDAAKADWTDEFIERVKSEINQKVKEALIISDEYNSRKVTNRFKKIRKCIEGEESDTSVLMQFSINELKRNGWQDAESYPELHHLDAVRAAIESKPQARSLLEHAAKEIDAICEESKSVLCQFDFADLLQNLYKAVTTDSSRLPHTIRNQYPVALVDEFQDTDPWQYGTLKEIYVKEFKSDSGLIIIGDPKQSIYGFRGADLVTYLEAISDAGDHKYTLSGNYRSTHQLVSAVNHIFKSAVRPFDEVSFVQVQAKQNISPIQVGSAEQVAITVWYSKTQEPLSKVKYRNEMAAVFAAQMVDLLNQKVAKPNEMAVLVRDAKDALSIRKALGRLGVRSVYLSDHDSVYASEEAFELRTLLIAIADPKSTSNLRSAVATKIWGLDFEEIEALFLNEVQWEELVEKFHRYQKIWQYQGFLPMLHYLIHDNGLAKKLLNAYDIARVSGERILTNLMHLGDLLQTASLGLHGEGALIRYLEQQLNDPKSAGDSSIVRLESEADLVKVLTIHKSKGLQFPLVFLPFISNFKVEDSSSDRDDESRLSEDIRLLYVALTRAEKALWMGLAPVVHDFLKNSEIPRSAVSKLLGRTNSEDLKNKLDLWGNCPNISVSSLPEPVPQKYVPDEVSVNRRLALNPTRCFNLNWWTASFSSISKGTLNAERENLYPVSLNDEKFADSQNDNSSPTNDAQRDPTNRVGQVTTEEEFARTYDLITSSSTFGTSIHELLEWQFNHDWPLHEASPKFKNEALNSDWISLVEGKSLKLGLDLAKKELLLSWIKKIVTTRFMIAGNGFSLDSLSLETLNLKNAWAELGFTLPIKPMNVSTLDTLITKYVMPNQIRPSLMPKQLNGMLTGFMDMVFEDSKGKHYVVDYKSNKLNGYGKEELADSILSHRYDVQYTLYLVALHRLLKSRLSDYDFDTHIGGAIYLFLRGVETQSQGLFVDCPSKELIFAIDDAFRGA